MNIENASTNSPLRSFLYVDPYKLNSLSSQLFSGFTEHIVERSREGTSDSESQKGDLGSGRVLSDTAHSENSREERRVIHDYAYSRLETELMSRGRLLSIGPEDDASDNAIANASFVKVSGRTTFLDLEALGDFMAEFNKFGEAITYTTTLQEREEAAVTLREQLLKAKDRNAKTRLKAKISSLADVKEMAKKQGLHHDQKSLESMGYLLKRGLGDHFEAQVRHGETDDAILFSALLKREYLRENESVIIKKYGRDAQRDFTMVGLVCQRGQAPRRGAETREIEHLRDAVQNMALSLREIEEAFFVPYSNEVVLDPIAVYLDL